MIKHFLQQVTQFQKVVLNNIFFITVPLTVEVTPVSLDDQTLVCYRSTI